MNFRIKIPEFKIKVPMPKPETETRKLQREMNELSKRHQKLIMPRRKMSLPRIRIGRHLRNINPMTILMPMVLLIVFMFVGPTIFEGIMPPNAIVNEPASATTITQFTFLEVANMGSIISILILAGFASIMFVFIFTIINGDFRFF